MSVNEKITNIAARTVMELDMKNKELITELANRMDWTSKEVSDMQYDSPEVDPEILISKDTPLSPGSFYQVKVIDAQAFDLYGKVLN